MTNTIVVAAGVASRRLDVYLAAELGWSRSAATAAIKAGLVLVDGVPAKASLVVTGGEIIIVEPAADTAPADIDIPDLPIVYEDDDMLVIDKPAGVVVHSGNGQIDSGTVAAFARLHSSDLDPERPGIVHRLDKDTSGLLVIAKTSVAKAILQKSWANRAVKKTYIALVLGRIEPDAAVIDLPLDRDPATPTRRKVAPSGRPAVTRYQTLAVYPGYTLVEAFPETGRTHQLRVHFAAVGHPIAGDAVYGQPPLPAGLARQFLHASKLSLTSPSGQILELESPLPPDLQTVLTGLDNTV